MNKIIDEIVEERNLQIRMRKHDERNSQNDWISYIVAYAGRAVRCSMNEDDYRECLIKVAALCIAAIESYDNRKFL